MLAHITNRNEDTKCTEHHYRTKPNTFHEEFCKTEIDQEGLTQVT